MRIELSPEALAALQHRLDTVAKVNALMYDDLDTLDEAKAILAKLNGLATIYRSVLQYIDALRDDFEGDAAMTGHEQAIFRLVGDVLGHNSEQAGAA
jgi:hypothetical protein